MHRRLCSPGSLFLSLALVVAPGAARADETEPFHEREGEELAYRAERRDEDELHGALFAAIDVGARVVSAEPRRHDLLASLTVGGTFGAAPRAAPDAESLRSPDPPDIEAAPSPPAVDLAHALRLGNETVQRVRAHVEGESELARIEDLSARARWSALLPELRLRIARVVDEDRAFSPTEYDPNRITSGNQESFWIEGRAAFRLDRLVFASEEVSLERLRFDRQREARRAELEAIAWLRRYARADAIVRAGTAPPDELVTAALDRAEASVTLDALTGGWFAAAARGLERSTGLEEGSTKRR